MMKKCSIKKISYYLDINNEKIFKLSMIQTNNNI